jgi:hypothetical protein
MARGIQYLEAWYRRSKPVVSRYLGGAAQWLHLSARAEAGGKSSPRKADANDREMMAVLTTENVQNLTDADLMRLHRICHSMEEKS